MAPGLKASVHCMCAAVLGLVGLRPGLAQPAEPAVIALPDIEVGAEPPPAVNDGPEDPAEVPVTSRSREEIEHLNANNAADALLGLPGVQLDGNSNQADRFQQVRIRGFEPRYTLVLIDGQRQTGRDADGSADLSAIPTSAIERIDIVRGPLAILYGGDSIAGVVDIVTAGDVERDEAHATAGYGAFNTTRLRARGQASAGAADLRVDGAIDVSDGWSDRLDYDRELQQRTPKKDARATWSAAAGAQAGWRPVLNHRLELRGRFSRRVRERARESFRYVETGTSDGYEDNRDLDLTGVWTADLHRSVRLTTTAHSHGYWFDRDDHANLVLRSSGRDVGTSEKHSEQTVRDALYSARSRLDWQQTESARLRVQIDGRYQRRRTDDSADLQRRDVNGVLETDANFRDPSQIYTHDQTVSSLTAEQRFRPIPTVLVIGGLRGEYDPRWGSDVGAALSAAWRILPMVSVRYSAGRGFKRPSFDSLALPPTPQFSQVDNQWKVGNPDLVPEHAWAQEVGVRLMLPGTAPGEGDPLVGVREPWAVLGLVGFRNDFDDKIVTQQISEWAMTPYPLVRERNIARARTQGIEAEARVGIGDLVTVGASVTWLQTRDLDTGTPFDLTPEQMASGMVALYWAPTNTRLTSTLNYVGTLRHFDAVGDHRPEDDVDALLLLSIKLEQGLGRWLPARNWGTDFGAFVTVSNGLDWFWDRDGDGDTDLPPTSIFAGVRMDFLVDDTLDGGAEPSAQGEL